MARHTQFFTPYSRKWKEKLTSYSIPVYESEKHLYSLKHLSSDYFPELAEIGYQLQDRSFPEKKFDSILVENYAKTRDFPAESGHQQTWNSSSVWYNLNPETDTICSAAFRRFPE